MRITIGGQNGSGKSTIAKFLAKELRLKHYSAGDFRGQLALKMKMTIDELNKLGEKEVWTDKVVDDYQVNLGKTEDNFVVDGRLSWFFIPDSIKIFLKVKPEIAAERIFKDQRPDEEKQDSVEKLKKMLVNRYKHDIMRYKKYYHVDISDLSNYDLVIDTSEMSKKEASEVVLKAVKKFAKM